MIPAKSLQLLSFNLLLALFLHSTVYASSQHNAEKHLAGYVLSGETPIQSATVRLFQAGTKYRAAGAKLLGKTLTDASGYFYISYKPHSKPGHPPEYKTHHQTASVLYLVAEGSKQYSGQRPIKLTAILNNPEIPDEIIINDLSTVAMAYSMAQFTEGRQVGGKNPGLKNAAATAQNLADLSNGNVATLLKTAPNGELTSTWQTFNSLANMLAACVQEETHCVALFNAAKPPRGAEPRDTFAAMTNIAQNPGTHVSELFAVSTLSSTYQPTLSIDAEPGSWILALRYNGDGLLGQKMDGPGNVAFDSKGYAWINNNFEFSLSQGIDLPPPEPPICGSTKVFKLTPTGGDADGAPYGGVNGEGENAGGLYGAGFGIGVDPHDNAWISNFGFKGPDCQELPSVLAISVSKFSSSGERLSLPDGDPTLATADSVSYEGAAGGFGYDGAGEMLQPQGILSDRQGNIWVANCASQPIPDGSFVSTVTRFPHGDPDKVESYSFNNNDFSKPFDVAIDELGHAWVTGNGSNNIVELDRQGIKIGDFITGAGISRPMGIATDSEGNLWVANAGLPNPPCPAVLSEDDTIGPDGATNTAAAVTLIRHQGETREVTTFGKTAEIPRDGLRWPWGIAVDGNDNVWIANFAGKRVMQLCGVKEQNCPPGVHTGDPISPDSGYVSDALKRVTGIQVDPSGNLWAVNNYEENGLTTGQLNPGGHEVVVFIGAAAPVKTPLLGPVRQP